MKIIYMGTPDFAVHALEKLAGKHEIVAVYSQPPRPAGRGKALRRSPVHEAAERLELEVRTPVSLRDPAVQAAFAALNADVAVVAAYGLILPQAVLDAPKFGCLNIHGSLLPRWRGAAPVQRAILAGDSTTGITIMQMEAGLDTGPMLAKRAIDILPYDTAGSLTDKLSLIGAEMIDDVLNYLPGTKAEPQSEIGVEYARKIDKAESKIDFAQGAQQVLRQIRAFNPPGAWFEVKGERIRILDAAILTQNHEDLRTDFPAESGLILDDQLAIGCGAGAIRPISVQRAGRGIMNTLEFLRGFPIPPGTRIE